MQRYRNMFFFTLRICLTHELIFIDQLITEIYCSIAILLTLMKVEIVSCGLSVFSCDASNAICHAIEAVFLHDLKGSSTEKVSNNNHMQVV